MAEWMKAPVDPPDPVELKTDVPHSARIYDYLLGGKDNFAADRAAAAHIVEALPSLPGSMRANREFMVRTTRFMAAELGLRQFLDIGTGLPTVPNLHQVAQEVAPESRVVYVDNDPLVLVHARALLTSTPEGRTAYLDADLRDYQSILEAPELREILDLSKPVAVSLIAILHFFTDDEETYRIVSGLMEPLVPGSVLALSTATLDVIPDDDKGAAAYQSQGIPMKPRLKPQVERYFNGLELLEPGLVPVTRWRALSRPHTGKIYVHGGVAIKR